MTQVDQSDINYCPDCACMIEEWWNYCAICGCHTGATDQQPPGAEPAITERRRLLAVCSQKSDTVRAGGTGAPSL